MRYGACREVYEGKARASVSVKQRVRRALRVPSCIQICERYGTEAHACKTRFDRVEPDHLESPRRLDENPMKASSSNPPESPNKAFAVYDQLRMLILNHELRPGNKLGHQMLAELLGVSRTPVRESLERLLQEGLVVRLQNRGYYVAEITASEAVELYNTREALETFQLNETMQRGLKATELSKINKMQKSYAELVGYELSRQRLLADREFHLTLAALGGNRFLVKSLEAIFDRLILKRRMDGYNDSGGEPLKEHQRLLDAIRDGDKKAASAALSKHIKNARDRQMNYLRGAPSSVAWKRIA